jgi:resuscitation-promoting factor RpfB
VRRSRILLSATTVAALLAAVGGGTAYASLGKSVTVTVDGAQHKVHTFASTVAGALNTAGVQVSSHDLVVPDASSALRRGSQINVRHAHSLALTVDGRQRTVWVLADSVGEALDQFGLGGGGASVSASRSKRLPLTGFALTVRQPHLVTILADGRSRKVNTIAPTVGDLLRWQRIALAATDKVSVPLSTYPADGASVRITRIRQKVETATSALPYSTVRKADSSLSKGQSRTGTAGHAGSVTKTYLVTSVDGKVSSRKLTATKTVAAARTAVVYYGTKPVPAPARSTSSGGSSSSGSSGSYSGSTGGLNWSALAQCESGGNPRAVNPSGTYRGLYQFSISTWQSVGGSGDPINASASEQTYRAYILYQRSGSGQWPVCGRNL